MLVKRWFPRHSTAVLILLMLASPGWAAQYTPVLAPTDSARIDISDRGRQARHPITLNEIVSHRELGGLSLAPDGTRLAFVVRQGFRDLNAFRAALYVVGTAPGSVPVKLLEEQSTSGLRWTPDGRFLTYLSSKSGTVQLWRVNPATGAAAPVFQHAPGPDHSALRQAYTPSDSTPIGVLSYEWSPDGQQVAFIAPAPPDTAALRAQTRQGVIYDDERMGFLDFVHGTWGREGVELWVYDLASGRERRLRRFDGDEIGSLAWAPDGRRIAVSYLTAPVQQESMIFWNHDVGVISVDDSALTPVATGEAFEDHPAWSPDGRSLAFISSQDERSSLGIVRLATRERRDLGRGTIGRTASRLWWYPTGSQLLVEARGTEARLRGKSALYAVALADGAARPVSQDEASLDNCTVSADHALAACVRQGAMVSPDPAVVRLATGAARPLATVNPEFRDIVLGEVTEVRWTNRYGDSTNGYLVKPVSHTPGRRYPLLVITYGFRGDFITDAEWMPNYPVQAFARDGFAVLLVNAPPVRGWVGKDFARGAHAEGYSPLASMEEGVRMLVRQGLADSTRVGVLGVSYGCFLAEFALTHSTLFHVASVANGGDYNPGTYWALGRRPYRENYERVLGGPPYGETLTNWQQFSPALNAHRVRAPVLMEFSPQEGILGLEMSAALRRHGVPVEFVVYPDDGHIFTQPEHRYYSMQRNLDWFAFWLQGREDPDSTKQEQYARWRAMREELTALVRRSGAE